MADDDVADSWEDADTEVRVNEKSVNLLTHVIIREKRY